MLPYRIAIGFCKLGKRYMITVKSGARYSGEFQGFRKKEKIILTKLCVINKFGAGITSGSSESRMFALNNIMKITLQEDTNGMLE